DVLIDGAMIGGGDLGNVRLGKIEEFPSRLPDEFLLIPKPESTFVHVDEANGVLTYDPETGDILIEVIDILIESVELSSPQGYFTGAVDAKDRYIVGSFDEANANRFFRIAWDTDDGIAVYVTPSFERIYLPNLARTGLSQAEFIAGVHPVGTTDPRGRLDLALQIGPAFGECREHISSGVPIGDANLDGRFDTQDLVTVFQANEYEDGIVANSTWSEGDWTCDGDFSTSDLVAAFQAGNYELPAAAEAKMQIQGQDLLSLCQDVAARLPASLENQFNVTHDKDANTLPPVETVRRPRLLARPLRAID
ncbi:MAG: hypothetical protein KDB27_25770, partial [Planctomycetales bacterium]|nr:hypothetical protein [Planctomycetales bacterium]